MTSSSLQVITNAQSKPHVKIEEVIKPFLQKIT
jgi:hypothetical protein